MWAFTLWKRFSPDTAPGTVQLTAIFLAFLSSTINPFIYAARNRVFGEEFCKLLSCWRVRSAISEPDFGANRKRNRCEKTPETATPFLESLVSPPGDGKQREQISPENEFEETGP